MRPPPFFTGETMKYEKCERCNENTSEFLMKDGLCIKCRREDEDEKDKKILLGILFFIATKGLVWLIIVALIIIALIKYAF